ncbi:hypothetical protein GCM10009623_13280 [Nocardioides aestuarii]
MWLDDLLRNQRGVVSRAQARACGLGDHDIRRILRRREWATVFPGIYLNHTGPTTWEQRAMAGVLHGATELDHNLRPVGAALAGHAALRSAIGPGWRSRGDGIEVAIEHGRSRERVRGYRFVRVTDLATRTDDVRTPPRLRLPEALADLAIGAGDELEVVQTVADACQSRMVSAHEVRQSVERRGRVRGRQALLAVLDDVAGGTCSALEHRFVTGVVRAHGLPMPQQQRVRTVVDEAGRREYRDCEWDDAGLVVELDGRQFHDNPRQRDRDLDRDLDDAAGGRRAVRLGWGQATRRRCRTARRLATILQSPHDTCRDCQ